MSSEKFDEVRKSIDEALTEIKKTHPDLYDHLKRTIKMDPVNHTFGYFPEKPEALKDEVD